MNKTVLKDKNFNDNFCVFMCKQLVFAQYEKMIGIFTLQHNASIKEYDQGLYSALYCNGYAIGTDLNNIIFIKEEHINPDLIKKTKVSQQYDVYGTTAKYMGDLHKFIPKKIEIQGTIKHKDLLFLFKHKQIIKNTKFVKIYDLQFELKNFAKLCGIIGLFKKQDLLVLKNNINDSHMTFMIDDVIAIIKGWCGKPAEPEYVFDLTKFIY